MPVHVVEELCECVGRHEVARSEARAVLERERGRIDLHGVDEKTPLDVEAGSPGPLAAELPSQDLEQHLGEPVLAGVENGKDDVRKRPAGVFEERGAATANGAVG